MNYTGKHVLVLGLGESGLASALWLAHCGATVRVADTRSAPERLPLLQQAIPAVEFIASGEDGGFAASLLDGIDFVVTSPGLAPHRELKNIQSAATDRGAILELSSQLEALRNDIARMRGQLEVLANQAESADKRQKRPISTGLSATMTGC